MKWWTFAFIWVLDVGLAFLLTYFDDRTDKAYLFFMALAFLWVLPALIGLWTLLKFWLCYHLFIKSRLVKYYKVLLHKHGFPIGAGFFGQDDYLSSVMDDPDIDLQTKLKAAFFLGEMASFRAERKFTMGYAIPLAFRQAMDEYRP